MCAGDSKGHCRFSRNHCFFFAGISSYSGSSSAAGPSADRRSFTSTGKRADQCACGSTATDLSHVALGMALSFAEVSGTGDVAPVDRGQAQSQLPWSMQASAGLGTGYFTGDFLASPGHGFSVDHNTPGQSAVPGLAGVGTTGVDCRTETNGNARPCGNAGGIDQQSRAEQQY